LGLFFETKLFRHIMRKETQLIFNFFIKPEDESFSEQTITGKIKWLLFVLVLEMPFSLVAGFMQQLLFKSGLVSSEDHLVNEIIKNENIFIVIIILVLFVPIIEELIFRLPLRFKKANFIPLAVILLFFAGTLLFNKLHLSPGLSIPLFTIVMVFIIFCFFNQRMSEKWGRILSSNYPLYFYGVTILFALAHLTNFTYSVSLLLFAPIVVLPQFIGGFFMGYIRIKQGFIWGFFLHVLHNAIFILPVLLFPSFNNPKLIEKIDKDDYSFEVYEGYHFSSPEFVKSNPTTSVSKVTPNEIALSGTFKYVVFSINIPNDDFNNLKLYLESNYGMTIEKKTEKRDMLVVY